MQLREPPSPEAAIIGRLAAPDEAPLSPAAAEGILAITFGKADKVRMNALAAKAREGALTPKEQAEAEAYSRIGSLLGILKSKARHTLKGRLAPGARCSELRTRGTAPPRVEVS
jgi:hypothetical protein